jgi:RimJ/RimL family protein N-acetyltransferase
MSHTLETPRLLLEPWHERRVEAFVELTGDDRVMEHIGRGGAWARPEALARFHDAADHWRRHAFGWRSVVDKASQAWIGLVALNRLGPGIVGVPEDEIEIGWWLHPTAWHRGFGTEAARAVCAEAFGRLGAPRLIARCRPTNQRSLDVMGRLGMTPWRPAIGRHGEQLAVHALDRATWRTTPAGSPA